MRTISNKLPGCQWFVPTPPLRHISPPRESAPASSHVAGCMHHDLLALTRDPASRPVAVRPSTPQVSGLFPAPVRQLAGARHRMAIGWIPHSGGLSRRQPQSAGVAASRPRTRVHGILQRLPGLECRRCRRHYRNRLSCPRVTSGTGRSASGAEGPESRDPHFLATGKCVANSREHTVYRLPGY